MMEALRSYQPAFLEDVPVSLQIIAFGAFVVVVYYLYSVLTVDQPLKGFPVVALSEKGLSSKWSWYTAGRETIAKGLKEHNAPFQIITGTGPKVRCLEQCLDDRPLTTSRLFFRTVSPTRFALVRN